MKIEGQSVTCRSWPGCAALLAIGSFLLAGCAADSVPPTGVPDSRSTLGDTSPAASAATPTARGRASAEPTASPAPEQRQAEYHIGPGDELKVFVFNQPDLTVTVPVRPDGLISMPLVESMPASGKTPGELGRDIEQRLSEFVRSPKVTVIVTSFVGTYADQIRVVGEAVHPQALPFKNGMKLIDVMIAVGGLGQFAAGNRAHVLRTEQGKQVEIKVRLNDLLNRGDTKQNVEMHPGDILIIPQSRF